MAGLAANAVKPLYSAERIGARVREIAGEIAGAGLDDPIVVAVLKGSFVFAADLVRALHGKGLRPEIDFIYLACYDGRSGLQGRSPRPARY